MTTYTDVQFIGYALPTTPSITAQIGFPSFVEGQYIGIDPPCADIDARIGMMMHALGQTIASGAVDASPSTLKIFVMPEFTLRGPLGAYDNDPPAVDYFTYFRTQLAKCVADPVWDGWLFVAGTIVETVGYVRGRDPALDREALQREQVAVALAAAWASANANAGCAAAANYVFTAMNTFAEFCNDHPLYKVTDTCYVLAGGPPDADYPEGLSVQKEFLSSEDFVLNFCGKGFTEESCAYPPVPEGHGEDKRTPWDPYSIFTIKGIRFGVEICLDHYNARLRTYRKPDSELVQIQLVPSCGMQIQQPSIIAGAGGLVFNCDGQYSGGGAPAATLWNGCNGGHTQLTQVTTPCSAGPPATDAVDAGLTTPPVQTVTAVYIDAPAASMLYAYGPGEAFVYSPVPVPPPAGGTS